MMWLTNYLLLVFLAYFVAPEENYVYNYNVDNFKTQIEQLDGNFVMFYAPWCRHCTVFYPIWNKLAELVNSDLSNFAIAQVDCTEQAKLCNENDITGYPTLLYFHKNSLQPITYKGSRDLPALTFFLSEIFSKTPQFHDKPKPKQTDEVTIYSGMAYLNDQNVEKFLSKGQHFVMFYTPWCRASQALSPVWAELAVQYAHSIYVQIGKIDCMENKMTCESFDVKQYPHLMWILNGRIMGVTNNEHTLDQLKGFVEKMLLAENHDPDKFVKKKKALPVARITEDTFDTLMENNIVYINFFAPWCSHCMQLNPVWIKLGERYQNDSKVIIADIDCVKSKPICVLEKIINYPTLVLYKNKVAVSIDSGGKSLDSLIANVQEQLQSTAPRPDDGQDMKDEL